MPVRKFRTVADMPDLKKRTPLDPDNLRLACELTQLAYWLHPMKHVPGVRKYRSLEEAWEVRAVTESDGLLIKEIDGRWR